MMKKNVKMAFLAFMLTVGLSETMAQPQWPEVKREAKSGSRWWWMGSAVDQANLSWNLQQYADAGLGTLEITPIYGVKGNAGKNISFLSEKWLEMLKYTKQEAEARGIDIDMPTGTGWPFGGPMLTAPETASKLYTESVDVTGDGTALQTLSVSKGHGTFQRLLAFPKAGTLGTPVDLTDLVADNSAKWMAPTGEWTVISVFCQHQVMQVKRPSTGGEGYVLDYFDADAVAHYLQYFENKFAQGGDVYPHSFFNDSYEITQADWTRDMFAQFEKYRGYKLETVMDKLLAKDPQVLADYRLTLSDMLLHNFTDQWTEWAHRHGVTTRNQAHGSPGNLIDLYAAADIPETETFYLNDFGIRGLRVDKGFTMTALSSPTTLKYASSAAHVTGKPLTSSESLTWLTEHFRSSLSQMKPEIDQLFAAGVNHILFHGTTYSPQEAAWPGWKFYAAVDMSPTNSIWRDAPNMMEYIERTQSFLQMGQPDNELLVYAPFVNAMHKNTGSFSNQLLLFDINTLDQKMPDMVRCVEALKKAGYDCDYISDALSLTTTFNGGMLQTAAGVRYKALVVPVADDMPSSVKAHLDDLAAQGAHIVYQYDEPSLQQTGVQPEQLRREGLSMIRRSNETGYHYFVANLTPNDFEGYVTLAVPFAEVYFFSPLTGQIKKGATDGSQVYVSLKSGQSVIIKTYDAPQAMAQSAPVIHEMTGIELTEPWTLSFTADTWPTMGDTSYALDKPATWETLDAQTARLMGTGVYETTFLVTAAQMRAATEGFLLDLGDVRESARVWLNGEYVGCAWSVPFELSCGNSIKEGTNTLRIEVTNLPANRIRQMDIDGIVWRNFEDINMSNISTATYDKWALVPSGLNSMVRLVPLTTKAHGMLVADAGMKGDGTGDFFANYLLATTTGEAIETIDAMRADGTPFNDLKTVKTANGGVQISVMGTAESNIIVTAHGTQGGTFYTTLPAKGAYDQKIAVDFTSADAPGGDWMKLASTTEIKGFSATGAQEWYRARLNGKEVVGLYDGLTFSSEKSNYYFFFPGYGMYSNNDFTITTAAQEGDIVELGYLVGQGNTLYDAADSLISFSYCKAGSESITIEMPGNSHYYIYRSLAAYRPKGSTTAVQPLWAVRRDDVYYTPQGVRVKSPRQGIYIKNGRKVIIFP